MVQGFKLNTKRYTNIFNETVEKLMPKKNKDPNPDDVTVNLFRK